MKRRAWLGAVMVVLLVAGCLAPSGTSEPRLAVDGNDRQAFDEPWDAREFDVVTDPTDPDRLTMGFVIPKPSPRFYWLGIATSSDGGESWEVRKFCGDWETPGPEAVGCPFAGAVGITDPALTVLHDGTVLYLGVMVHGFDVAQFAARFPPDALEPESVTVIARSAFDAFDGAHMVPAPLRLYYNGKANVLQEPDAERIHAVWAVDFRIEEASLDNIGLPVWSYSDDGGRTWSQPRGLSGHGFGDLDAPFAVGADIVKSLDGRLHVAWWDGKTNRLQMVTSADGGDRWTPPRDIADARGRPDDQPVDFYNITRPWFHVARTGPHAGDAYIVYDHIEDGDRDIMMVRSGDHGLNWEAPVLVSHLGAADGQDETLPRMIIEPSGALSVLYVTYEGQWRSSGHHMHLARSTDGGATFQDVRLSSDLSPLRNVGDYNALAVAGERLLAVWEDGRGGSADAHRAWQAFVPLAA